VAASEPPLRWRRVELASEPSTGPQVTLLSARCSPQAFAAAWEDVVARNATGWIKLHAVGVVDGVLVVSVEHRAVEQRLGAARSPERISVNLSGIERGQALAADPDPDPEVECGA